MPKPMTKNLLEGLVTQDTDAIRQFIDEYWLSCCRYAYVLTSDVHLAEDIAQEAFVKVLKNVRSFDSARPLRPWLFKIIENTKREHDRREAPEDMGREGAEAGRDAELDLSRKERAVPIDEAAYG